MSHLNPIREDHKCPYCGATFPAFQTYCSNCGYRVLVRKNYWTTTAKVVLALASGFIALPMALLGGGSVLLSLISFTPENVFAILFGLSLVAFAMGIFYATAIVFKK